MPRKLVQPDKLFIARSNVGATVLKLQGTSLFSLPHWAETMLDNLAALLQPHLPPAFRPLQLFMPGRQEAFTQPVQAAPLSSEMH